MSSRAWLVVAGLLTLIGWQFEAGRMALYPFTWLATYIHEMGHGLTALALGGHFDRLVMNADGSGLAYWHGDIGRIGRGIIALGGLVGPSIAGALVLVLSRKVERARPLLYVMAVLMMVSALLFARSLFALVFILGAASAQGIAAHYSGRRLAPFLVQLIGVQMCLAVFRDLSYMFSEGGLIDGVLHRSDSAAIAEALFLPYWFWGGLAAVFSFGVLALGLAVALGGEESVRPEKPPLPDLPVA